MRTRVTTVPSTAAVVVIIMLILSGHCIVDAATTKETWTRQNNNMPLLNDDMIAQLSASIMGESALVDKETGRIIWEGGDTSTLSASLAPFLGYGIKHVRATMLTGIFLLAIIGSIMARIHRWVQASIVHSSANADGRAPWPVVHALLWVAQWTIFRIPQLNATCLLVTMVLYLIESYTCSTRRYLANAIASPIEVEEYVEQLRQELPVVTWKVRCFHYERRKWISLLRILTMKRGDDNVDLISSSLSAPPSTSWLLSRKVVTHKAMSSYNYTSCDDKTVAGVWRRAEATADSPAPFSKIVLSKLLILPTAKARDNYFKQQSKFVTSEGRDEYTEFSTSIQVKGFRRRVLAVRPVEGVPSTKLFRLHLFWMFTFVGLTVPYRIWFARHCDELRVTVTKETTNEKPGSSSSSWGGWFSRSSTTDPSVEWNRIFKRKMQELALYTSTERSLSSIQSTNATKSDETLTRTDEQTYELNATIANNGTIPETVIVERSRNATEPDVESNGASKEGKNQPQPAPQPTTATDSEFSRITEAQVSTESSIDNE